MHYFSVDNIDLPLHTPSLSAIIVFTSSSRKGIFVGGKAGGEKRKSRIGDDLCVSFVAPGKKLEQLGSRGEGHKFPGLHRKIMQVSGQEHSCFDIQMITCDNRLRGNNFFSVTRVSSASF